MGPILNVSFYRFLALGDLPALRDRVKARAIADGLRGSILLSEEGINGFLAGEPARLRAYLDWLFAEIPGLTGLRPKESYSANVPFTRMLVKIKKEIITMGRPDVRPAEKTGRNLPPAELKRWYDERKDFVIVDTRNDYEVAQGAFAGAVHYGIETFREFPDRLAREAANLRDKTVVMYCTGGIRCEKATALAMDLGIRDVYQLEGGILKYFEEVGGRHYRGECFVFDHRAAVDAELRARPENLLREKLEGLRLDAREGSPEGRAVEMAMQAKGLVFDRVADSAGTRPVLASGGRSIEGARAIFAHLDARFGETRRILPAAEERRDRMALWLDWVEGTFAPEARKWAEARDALTAEECRALEVRLEKHLYRLKTPLQRRRRFLVVDDVTAADFAAYAILADLRAGGFPTEFPERFALVWDWAAAVEASVREGLDPRPKVMRRSPEAVWPN